MNIRHYIHSSLRRALRSRLLAPVFLRYWLWRDGPVLHKIGAATPPGEIRPVQFGFWVVGTAGEVQPWAGEGPSGFHARLLLAQRNRLLLTAWGDARATLGEAFSEAQQMARDWMSHPHMRIAFRNAHPRPRCSPEQWHLFLYREPT